MLNAAHWTDPLKCWSWTNLNCIFDNDDEQSRYYLDVCVNSNDNWWLLAVMNIERRRSTFKWYDTFSNLLTSSNGCNPHQIKSNFIDLFKKYGAFRISFYLVSFSCNKSCWTFVLLSFTMLLHLISITFSMCQDHLNSALKFRIDFKMWKVPCGQKVLEINTWVITDSVFNWTAICEFNQVKHYW